LFADCSHQCHFSPLSLSFHLKTPSVRATELQFSVLKLTPTVPSELSLLTNLVHLALETAQLTSAFPMEVTRLLNLEHLSLQKNELTSGIPSQLSVLTKLKRVYLANNNFGDRLRGRLRFLVNLVVLDVSGNNIGFGIPDHYSDLTALQTFRMHDNNFDLPLSVVALDGMRELRELRVDNNKIAQVGSLTLASCQSFTCLVFAIKHSHFYFFLPFLSFLDRRFRRRSDC
jgi:Leucine-rich repeat (LRR) protein